MWRRLLPEKLLQGLLHRTCLRIRHVAMMHIKPHLPELPGSLMVPYKSIIYGGVQPGKCFVIQEVIHPQAKSPDFDEKVVVRNRYEDGKWGKEERSGEMPFETGQPFLVTICCCSDKYEVFVSGKQVHTYSRRKNYMEEIDVLEVSGDVQLTFVHP